MDRQHFLPRSGELSLLPQQQQQQQLLQQQQQQMSIMSASTPSSHQQLDFGGGGPFLPSSGRHSHEVKILRFSYFTIKI